ncbi:MAG: DCC1-like thiol-disulfide oxidoreductase family protein [Leptospiraceae bacterium]|nr:DCC1-like thiol-disulfide oxidoreductase family protein [Leptospiraceae bacterium]
MNEKYIILFDGVCNLCNGIVNMMIDLDKKDQFRFASIQSEIGQKISKQYNVNSMDLDSVVVIYEDKVYKKSSAVFLIWATIGFPFSMIRIFQILPTSFLDMIYDLIAKNRYKLFGSKDECRIPTPELKKKFL